MGWLFPVRSTLKRMPVQDLNYFSTIFYYIFSNTYQKIGDLFFPVIFVESIWKGFISFLILAEGYRFPVLVNHEWVACTHDLLKQEKDSPSASINLNNLRHLCSTTLHIIIFSERDHPYITLSWIFSDTPIYSLNIRR